MTNKTKTPVTFKLVRLDQATDVELLHALSTAVGSTNHIYLQVDSMFSYMLSVFYPKGRALALQALKEEGFRSMQVIGDRRMRWHNEHRVEGQAVARDYKVGARDEAYVVDYGSHHMIFIKTGSKYLVFKSNNLEDNLVIAPIGKAKSVKSLDGDKIPVGKGDNWVSHLFGLNNNLGAVCLGSTPEQVFAYSHKTI